MGCRSAETGSQNRHKPHRISIAAISLHAKRKTLDQSENTGVDSEKVPAAESIDDTQKLASASPLSMPNMPPSLLGTESSGIPQRTLTQEEFVHSLNGKIDRSTEGFNRIDLSETNISDSQLRELPLLPQIDHLNISKTSIGDAGLLKLADFTELKLLRLDNTRCSDVAITSILKLPKLELLGLSNTALSDQGLSMLCGSQTLRFLLLDNTRITDQGLQRIAALKTLEGLSLLHTNVSKAAVEQLQMQLPKCSIIYDGSNPKASATLLQERAAMHSVSFQEDNRMRPQHSSNVLEGLQKLEHSDPANASRSTASEPRTLPSLEAQPSVQLPLIHPLNRNYVRPDSSYGWANDTRPNQEGWLGARQAMTPAQAAARVGFTSPDR